MATTGADLSLSTHFAALKDPRVERTKRHRLLDILTIALCAVICGADTWVEIEEFGKVREAWLTTFLDVPAGIPSHDTFGRVFAQLDPEQFGRCCLRWTQAIQSVVPLVLAVWRIRSLRGASPIPRGHRDHCVKLLCPRVVSRALSLAFAGG